MNKILKHTIGRWVALYHIRTSRGVIYTTEIQGLINSVAQGGVVILLIKTYFNVLPPLWVLPILYVGQKCFEALMGYIDEKHLHWWEFENNYTSERLNPWNKQLMEKIDKILSK